MALDVETKITITPPTWRGLRLRLQSRQRHRVVRESKASSRQTPRPLEVRSRMAFVARFLSRRLAYVYEVKGVVQDERLEMETTDGPLEMETTYTWADAADGATSMRLRNRGELSGFSHVLIPDHGCCRAPGQPERPGRAEADPRARRIGSRQRWPSMSRRRLSPGRSGSVRR